MVDRKIPLDLILQFSECGGRFFLTNHISISPKVACWTHGPSQTPVLDRDLQSPHAREHIIALATALSELANKDNCTKCTVEKVSALLTLQARDIKVANRNKGWTKEDKRVRKVEFKILCQGVKKDMKALWKGKR